MILIEEESFNLHELKEIKHKISTMTVISRLDPCTFNVKNIIERLEPEIDNVVMIVVGNGHVRKHPEYTVKSTAKAFKNFQNSVTCVVRVSAVKYLNVKVFSNGALQVTGCRSSHELQTAINNLVDRLKRSNTPELNYITIGEAVSVETKTATINIDFKFKFKIALRKLDELLKSQMIKSDYDQQRHQGVNIQYCATGNTKLASIIVFCSGSTKIAGSDPKKIYESFVFIRDFIASIRDCVEDPRGLIDQIIQEAGFN